MNFQHLCYSSNSSQKNSVFVILHFFTRRIPSELIAVVLESNQVLLTIHLIANWQVSSWPCLYWCTCVVHWHSVHGRCMDNKTYWKVNVLAQNIFYVLVLIEVGQRDVNRIYSGVHLPCRLIHQCNTPHEKLSRNQAQILPRTVVT